MFCADFVAHSSHIPQRFFRCRVLLLSSRLGRFRRQSHLAWSCGQSNTLPLFKTLDYLPADKFGQVSVGLFTNLSRCYAAQSLRDTAKAVKPEQQQLPNQSSDCCQPSTDVIKSSDSGTGDNIHSVQSCSNDSVAPAASEEQHSYRSSAVQQTVVDSSEEISQKETLQKVGLMQRFRMMYKQYGVVLVCVHAVTSSVWVSLFYCATVRYG